MSRWHRVYKNEINFIILRIVLIILTMNQKINGKPSFIDQMKSKILEYELEKIYAAENRIIKPEVYKKEQKAKQTLMQLDEQCENSIVNEQDTKIGRWSNYRVPFKFEERISFRKVKMVTNNFVQPPRFFKDQSDNERNYYNYHCSSERTIPRLKVIMQQLETPLDLKRQKQMSLTKAKAKSIGLEAFIANKAEIKPSARFDKNNLAIIESNGNTENKRPISGYSEIKNKTASYQKIKRSSPLANAESNIIQEKQILSQLIKGSLPKSTSTINSLSNMCNYFTMTEDKKKKYNRGLNNILA